MKRGIQWLILAEQFMGTQVLGPRYSNAILSPPPIHMSHFADRAEKLDNDSFMYSLYDLPVFVKMRSLHHPCQTLQKITLAGLGTFHLLGIIHSDWK